MIGEWLDEGADSVVRRRLPLVGRSELPDPVVHRQAAGKPVMTVTQRIGWDPLARQIRSWEFDSEGGFGEGRWSRDGERWVVKHTGVRPEGRPPRPPTSWSGNAPTWSAGHRPIASSATKSIPDDEAYVLVRVPPSPRSRSRKVRHARPVPNTTRSPR